MEVDQGSYLSKGQVNNLEIVKTSGLRVQKSHNLHYN